MSSAPNTSSCSKSSRSPSAWRNVPGLARARAGSRAGRRPDGRDCRVHRSRSASATGAVEDVPDVGDRAEVALAGPDRERRAPGTRFASSSPWRSGTIVSASPWKIAIGDGDALDVEAPGPGDRGVVRHHAVRAAEERLGEQRHRPRPAVAEASSDDLAVTARSAASRSSSSRSSGSPGRAGRSSPSSTRATAGMLRRRGGASGDRSSRTRRSWPRPRPGPCPPRPTAVVDPVAASAAHATAYGPPPE